MTDLQALKEKLKQEFDKTLPLYQEYTRVLNESGYAEIDPESVKNIQDFEELMKSMLTNGTGGILKNYLENKLGKDSKYIEEVLQKEESFNQQFDVASKIHDKILDEDQAQLLQKINELKQCKQLREGLLKMQKPMLPGSSNE